MLQSYILKFNFKTDSGILDYLNNSLFTLNTNTLKNLRIKSVDFLIKFIVTNYSQIFSNELYYYPLNTV